MDDRQQINDERGQGVDLTLQRVDATAVVLVGHLLLSVVLQPGEGGESGAGSNPPLASAKGGAA